MSEPNKKQRPECVPPKFELDEPSYVTKSVEVLRRDPEVVKFEITNPSNGVNTTLYVQTKNVGPNKTRIDVKSFKEKK